MQVTPLSIAPSDARASDRHEAVPQRSTSRRLTGLIAEAGGKRIEVDFLAIATTPYLGQSTAKRSPLEPSRANTVKNYERILRHSLPVRIFHWTNVVCFFVLLLSGIQIFNAHPRLYWGATGYKGMPAAFEISGNASSGGNDSWMQIGAWRINTTGILGEVKDVPAFGRFNVAFPPWMTLPTGTISLGRGRGWHFLFFWIFTGNLAWYLVYATVAGRFRTVLLPRAAELTPRAILRDLRAHLRWRHRPETLARGYNTLQKLSYIGVILVLLPMQVLTGMTMSNSALAVFPFLLDLFGGRQSARTFHFIGAVLLVVFLLVHLWQFLAAGPINEGRAMITGYLRIPGKTLK